MAGVPIMSDRDVSLAEFKDLLRECRNSRQTSPRGVLPEHVVQAMRLVDTGTSISCARPIQTQPGPDNPKPAIHLMTDLPSSRAALDDFAADYLAVECHGDAQSHIDALCHITWEGQLWTGEKATSIFSSGGARNGGLELAADGLVSRGVLLDLPLSEAVPWIEPGHRVLLSELQRAEERLPNPIRAGDIVFVRTGHDRRRRVEGPWRTAERKAGIDVHAMPWFGDKGIAAMGFDGDGDVMPHNVSGVQFPIHVLGIAAMGLYFLDSLDLERLAEHCNTIGRWEFLCAIAPLHLVGGTGSLINPLAIF
jgi:kynurenine formamidase